MVICCGKLQTKPRQSMWCKSRVSEPIIWTVCTAAGLGWDNHEEWLDIRRLTTGDSFLYLDFLVYFEDTISRGFCFSLFAWWRHQMETFPALLAFCAGNSPVTREFPAQRPVMRSVDVFFDLRLDKRLSEAGDLRYMQSMWIDEKFFLNRCMRRWYVSSLV